MLHFPRKTQLIEKRAIYKSKPEPIIDFKLASNRQILFEGKAQFDSKAERTRQYVSILDRIGTQPSSKRWRFEASFRV